VPTVDGQVFTSAADGRRYSLAGLGAMDVRRAEFHHFQHPLERSLESRPVIRHLTLTRCHFYACELGPVVAEDCLIDTVWLHRGQWGGQRIAGCALKHVTIRGRVTGGIRFLPSPTWLHTQPHVPVAEDPFVRANATYYRDVDWAVDISTAEFAGSVETSWWDIPARLVRRDPETQVVVSRDSLASGDWRAAIEESAIWVGIERFLEGGMADNVIVAGKRSRWFEREMRDFARLRNGGFLVGS
jgi:hypothetical protein